MKLITNILIGGKAGNGIDKTSTILAKSLVKIGYYSFVYREYGSYIRGGHDFSIVAFSNKKINSHGYNLDAILALDEGTIKNHKDKLKSEGIIITSEKMNHKNIVTLNYKEILEKFNAPPITKNSAFLGCFFKIFNLPIKPLLEELKKEVGELNEKIALEAFEKTKYKIRKLSKPEGKRKKIFIDGTSAVGLGSIYYGLDFYFAYPMTPATKLLHFLSSLREKYDIKTFLLENEIAVVNASIGSNFAGAISMVGTSGGGFDLMAETLSLQGMSEVP
ncbi:MAG: 2-oxoacid:acceptor oxidoreductase family protein, partial [Candidatus Aenigmatarchaeota archaeon]